MKKTALLLIAVITTINLWAQQPLCPVKEGITLAYVTKDSKGKVQGYSRQTVTSIEGSGNNLTVTYTSEAMDAKKKTLSKVPVITYSISVVNGDVVVDSKALLNSVSTGSPSDGTAEGTPMVLPANMKAGDTLSDCEVKMKIAFLNISAAYSNGICEGEEQITTEAGSFLCKKTKYNCKSSAMGIKMDMIIHTWYAPGIGVVKTEVFNNKGKINNLQELVEISS